MHEFRGNSWLTNLLRVLAITGPSAVLVREMLVAQPLQQNQYYSFFPLMFAVIVVFAVIFAAFPAITASILRKPDILVPVGVYVTASELLSITWARFTAGGAEVAHLDFTALFTYASLTASIVSIWACQFVLAAFFAGWMTRTILKFVKSGEVDVAGALTGIGNWFPRALGVMLFGLAPICVFLFPAFLVAAAGGQGSLIQLLFLFLIPLTAIGTLLWNLATYGVLAHVLNSEDIPLRDAIREGVRLSWLNKAKVAVPVIGLLLISGWVVLVMVNFHRYDDRAEDFGKLTKSLTNYRQTNFNSDFVWAAGYPESTAWNRGLMRIVKAKSLPSVDLRLMMLMLLFSVVINIKIISSLLGNEELSRTESAIHSGGGMGAGLTIIATLAVAMIPFEYVGAIGNTERFTFEQRVESTEMIIVPNVYRGSDLFSKEEIFRLERNKSTGEYPDTGFGSGTAPKEEARPKLVEVNEQKDFSLAGIIAVYGGEVDEEPGTDILIAGWYKAFILTPEGRVKREFDYDIGYRDELPTQERSLNGAQIADLDGDGEPEIAGYGYGHSQIVDLSGKPVWKYPGKTKGKSFDSIRVGDIDNDGQNDVLVGTSKNLEAYTRTGTLLWDTEINGLGTLNTEIADVDKDGVNEVVSENDIYDSKGKLAGEIKRPSMPTGYLSQKGEPFGLLFFQDNLFGIFDKQGATARYEAPLSYRERPKRPQYAIDGAEGGLSIFRSRAIRVGFKKDQNKYLAVSAVATTPGSKFKIFYIYDGDGNLVYHENLLSTDTEMAILPNADGSESLLVNSDGRLLRYSM